jgi:capsular exopolysaccharide synthesis family protein
VQLLSSEPVKAGVRQRLGSAPNVSVDTVGQTDVITVSATSTDPKRAASVANAYADSFVDVKRNQAVGSLIAVEQQLQTKVSGLDTQIAALDAQVASASSSRQSAVAQSLAPQRSALVDQEAAFKNQLAQFQVNSAVETGAAQVSSPASIPTSPSSPLILRNTLLAVAVGLILGVVVAFVRDYFDDSLKTKEDLERAGSGLPVLGLVPALASWRDKTKPRVVSLTDPTSPAAEAYRAIRTSIQFLGLDRSLRTLQVTSPNAAEGKTATVANLGVALAWSGQRVIILGCDLRRPRIHEFFGLSNEVGFTSVLLGQVSFEDACQRVPGQGRLAVLASGPLPLNPAEALASRHTTELVAEARERADMVLVDCPPVLPVTDSAVLSARADATIVVASAGETTGRVIARAIEVLTQVGAPVVGTVLNAVKSQDSYGYANQYNYYGAHIPALGIDGSQIAVNGEPRQESTRWE